MLIRNTRRDIARVNTVLAERSRLGGAAPAAAAQGKETKPKRAPKKQTPEQET